MDLGFVSSHKSGSAVPSARTYITKVARFPSPGLQISDHMCAPTAWGLVAGTVVFIFFCFN